MRKKIELFVDDEEMETRQEKPHEPVSDEETGVLKNRIKSLMEHRIGVRRCWKNGKKSAKWDLRFLRRSLLKYKTLRMVI